MENHGHGNVRLELRPELVQRSRGVVLRAFHLDRRDVLRPDFHENKELKHRVFHENKGLTGTDRVNRMKNAHFWIVRLEILKIFD